MLPVLLQVRELLGEEVMKTASNGPKQIVAKVTDIEEVSANLHVFEHVYMCLWLLQVESAPCLNVQVLDSAVTVDQQGTGI